MLFSDQILFKTQEKNIVDKKNSRNSNDLWDRAQYKEQ